MAFLAITAKRYNQEVSTCPVTPNPAVNGPATVCGTASFTVTNTGGQPVHWRTSSDLSITGGQNTTTVQVRSVGDNNGWVEAIVGTGDCEVTRRRNVNTGTTIPPPTGISDPQPASGGYRLSLINPQPGVIYTWTVNGTNPEILSGQGTSSIVVDINGDCTSLSFVQARYNDGCNGSSGVSRTYDLCNNFTIYPNPTNNFLTVAFVEEENNTTTASLNTASDQEFSVELYNQMNIRVAEGGSQNGEITLDVRNLPLGVYVLHIIYQGEIYPHEILIE